MLLRAFAKINLDLRVAGRRADGFHEIRTVLQSIDLHDDIEIEPAGRFEFEGPAGLDDSTNLVVRAVRLFEQEIASPVNVRIRLVKRIPVGAGLGGGSSDAATTIVGLERLTGKRLTGQALMRLLRALGSDVPFFAVGGRAVGVGRGDEIYPLEDDCSYAAVLVTPGFSIRTADAYSWLTVSDISPSIEGFCAQFAPGRGGGEPMNEFEGPVFARYPALGSIRAELLRRGAVRAALSGSGSVVYGVFPSTEAALEASGRMAADFSAVVARPLGRADYFQRMVAAD
ncbi:MAG TPA: 4-(cytidine 5'-diphospho)-2-C-methyl-D-erythritol kinase [Terriglobia bacterium]|nr:4-(cytidine 5'-diphospho)-2-C-methyl-D-erythritol kinase [Terriglobia bacterium]